MGKWLSEFLAEHQESGPDKPDTMDSVSGMSGSETRDVAEHELLADAPTPPLRSGWLVCYRDARGRLCGGCDDREHGTVRTCLWENGTWTVELIDGARLPLMAVLSVGKTDATGRVLATWLTKIHGHDGERR